MTHRIARVATVAVVCAATLALSSCGGGDADGGQSADNGAAPSKSAAPSSATCKLKGESGGQVTLEQTEGGLTMTFVGLPVPEAGTALYSVTAYDAAGDQGGQLGVKYLGGEQIGYFVFDFGSAGQTNLDGQAQASADGITATIADADLGPLSGVEVASWSAAYTVNGNDVGTCPGGVESLPFPS